MAPSPSKLLNPKLSICSLVETPGLRSSVSEVLRSECYAVIFFTKNPDFTEFVNQEKQNIDCLLLEDTPEALHALSTLKASATLLPTVVLMQRSPIGANQLTESQRTESQRTEIDANAADSDSSLASVHHPTAQDRYLGEVRRDDSDYHAAVANVAIAQLEQLSTSIEQAIQEFLALPLTGDVDLEAPSKEAHLPGQNLVLQQRRLAHKLKERLGYLGVYYKRNPAHFLRHMEPAKKQEFLNRLKQDYREIVLNYFSQDEKLNQKIDHYVNSIFLADVPVAHVVEIHMDWMDEFSKQLKLEGRSEEILLDYRLTLIDTLANLCEMYRRSIPRES